MLIVIFCFVAVFSLGTPHRKRDSDGKAFLYKVTR